MEEQKQTFSSMTFAELIQLQEWVMDTLKFKFDKFGGDIPEKYGREYDKLSGMIFDIEEIILGKIEQAQNWHSPLPTEF